MRGTRIHSALRNVKLYSREGCNCGCQSLPDIPTESAGVHISEPGEARPGQAVWNHPMVVREGEGVGVEARTRGARAGVDKLAAFGA